MTSQAVNQSKIYSSFANDEMMAELVELFVSEIPDRINTLRSAFETADTDLLRRTAHQLKGAFGSYGFDELTAPAYRLEAAINSQAGDLEINERLEVLVECCQRMTADPAPC
jgi:histidine phosphotransfer protein HptB